MNPNTETSPSMHLPEPLQASPETAPEFAGNEPITTRETAAKPPQTAPAQTLAGMLPDDTGVAAAASTGGVTPLTSDLTAADDDKIEKSWIVRTKQIIAATQDDPREQNRQLSAFKADYIQKRYGKTIKLSE